MRDKEFQVQYKKEQKLNWPYLSLYEKCTCANSPAALHFALSQYICSYVFFLDEKLLNQFLTLTTYLEKREFSNPDLSEASYARIKNRLLKEIEIHH